VSQGEDGAAGGGATPFAEGGRLEVGRIVKAHGIRGEVVVAAVSNRSERFASGSVLFAGDRALRVERATVQGGPEAPGRMSTRRWIVAFEGIADRNRAETLRGLVLCGERLDGPGEDELWVHELVGSDVVDTTGRALGRVAAVEANPASDLLVLEEGGLVPMVFVVESGSGRVVIDPPDGLLEL
jgi:16S rRNA processing protein RimM